MVTAQVVSQRGQGHGRGHPGGQCASGLLPAIPHPGGVPQSCAQITRQDQRWDLHAGRDVGAAAEQLVCARPVGHRQRGGQVTSMQRVGAGGNEYVLDLGQGARVVLVHHQC